MEVCDQSLESLEEKKGGAHFMQAWYQKNLQISYQRIDCKTVRIFAYSSTREQSNKRSGMRLKTESETGERR